ncbi:MAG: hypothetical protein AB7N80_12765 [Bdellovibrionales bacterium]
MRYATSLVTALIALTSNAAFSQTNSASQILSDDQAWTPRESCARTAILELIKSQNIEVKETKGNTTAVVCEATK